MFFFSYSTSLNTMRDKNNSNWYKIWPILVRILSKDILKRAPIINKFLYIVEQGFRSSNLRTRAEAFLCWHVSELQFVVKYIFYFIFLVTGSC